jgi:hypothetical protein
MFCREPPWRPYHGHRAPLPFPATAATFVTARAAVYAAAPATCFRRDRHERTRPGPRHR